MYRTLARKPRNQRKHQQLCVDFLSRGKFCCVDGLKSASPKAPSLDRAISKLPFELGIVSICSW